MSYKYSFSLKKRNLYPSPVFSMGVPSSMSNCRY